MPGAGRTKPSWPRAGTLPAGAVEGTHALFALASAAGGILSRLLLSAPCQNIWCELPDACRWWVPSFEGAGRGGTGRDTATSCRCSHGQGAKGSMLGTWMPFFHLHPWLHMAVALKKKSQSVSQMMLEEETTPLSPPRGTVVACHQPHVPMSAGTQAR